MRALPSGASCGLVVYAIGAAFLSLETFELPSILVLAAAQLLAESFGVLIFRFTQLVVLLPLGAASARRLRDAGLSPWWTLIAFAPVAGIVALLYLHTFPSKAAEVPVDATAS